MKNLYLSAISLVIGLLLSLTAFAEPPETKWTVTGSSTLTIENVPEDGETAWIFTLPKAGGRLTKSKKGTATKLNFRTLVSLLPDGCKITNCGTSFKSDATIEELYWPDTITTINNNAFLDCSSLTVCDYPEGTKMTSIGSSAFQSCSKLTRFRMCDTITSIADFAFYKCSKIVFDGPVLPAALTVIKAKSFGDIGNSATPLQDGLLVIGSSGASVTWTPANNNTSNKYFGRFNITNLVFGEGVTHSGTNNYTGKNLCNPFAASTATGSSITNIVVRNPGVFAFSTVLTVSPAPTTVRQYDVAGWITGTLVKHSDAYKTRILGAKNKYWQAFFDVASDENYRAWDKIPEETRQLYWDNFNGGNVGTGDEIPHGIVLTKTAYTVSVDGETFLPLTIPENVWIVFKPGEWPEQLKSVEIPSAAESLRYTGSEQTGVPEGEGYTLTGHKATNAGIYTATATLEEGYKWADGSLDAKSIVWSIGVIQVPVAIEGLEYNGNEQIGVPEGAAYELTGHKATNVGTYTATVTLKEGYVWPDGTTDEKTISWTIAPGAISVPVAVTGLEYNGSEQTGVLEGEGYTLTGHKATNVGTYTATATLKDGFRWTDGTTDAKTIVWRIDGVAVPVAVTGLEYNGKLQTGVLAGEGYTLSGHTARNVGTYTASATLEDGYMWADGTLEAKSIVWTIGEESPDPVYDPLPDPEPDTVDEPAAIVYVDPSATGENNGTSWENAYTDFNVALSKLSAAQNVIWFAGTHVCSADCSVTVPSGVKAKIRGGFKGGETTADEREDGIQSVVSGNVRAYNTLKISSDSAVHIERIRFIDSKGRGIEKTGEGDLTLVDCDIVGCGFTLGKIEGRGFMMKGTAGKTRLFAERCTFAGNRLGGSSSQHDAGSGHGAAFINLARATLDDCLFATNGLPILTSPGSDTRGFRFFKGSALYAINAPVTARGTKFLFNRAFCSQSSDPSSDAGLFGATVRLETGTGGSAFTNCLWMANQNSRGFNNSSYISRGGGGELWFNPGKTFAKCDVVNCTFAANLNHISKNGAGGVNVRSGKVNILNSIFGGNLRIVTGTDVGEDIYVADGAEVSASYSLFSPDMEDEKRLFAAGPGTLTLGEGVVFDEPGFVSRIDEARYMQKKDSVVYHYLPVALDYLMNLDVHLLGRAGYYDAEKNIRICSYGENSPALDAGDPESDYSKEPCESWGHPGYRVNMGFYGNTPGATATPYKGFYIFVDGKPSSIPVEVVGRPDNDAPVEDIIVCDGNDDAVKIYRGTEVVWKWNAKEDSALDDHSDLRGRYNGLTEARICEWNGRKVVAISSSNCAWAIVDLATTNAVAYGYSRTPGQSVTSTIMPHSIALLPNDIVAVASTYTIDQNAPETKHGCYFFHIAGDKAVKYEDGSQCGTFFSIENPHGFYWDDQTQKLYVSSSEGLTRMTVAFDEKENKFEIEEEKVFAIAPLGVKWGHDLAVVPGTRKLVMTTYEMTLFFDMDKEEWLLDEIVWRMDMKGFDPHSDGTHVLATVPRSGYVTDTLEIWTKEHGFKDYLYIPGAQFYKARWVGDVLDK